MRWDRIARIERLPAEPVYDIEVEGTHNFVANGILAHNTALGTEPAAPAPPPAAEHKAGRDLTIEQLWAPLQDQYLLYHGTSTNYLESIRQHGLDAAQKSFISEYRRMAELFEKATGIAPAFMKSHLGKTISLTARHDLAKRRAEHGPEAIEFLLSNTAALLEVEDYRMRLTKSEQQELRRMLEQAKVWMATHHPLVLGVKFSAITRATDAPFHDMETFSEFVHRLLKPGESVREFAEHEWPFMMELFLHEVRVSGVDLEDLAVMEGSKAEPIAPAAAPATGQPGGGARGRRR